MFGWFKSERIAELEAKCRRLEASATEATERLRRNDAERSTIVSTLNARVVELQKKIREQDEADLYFLTAKIMRRLEAGEKKDSLEIMALQAQQQQRMMSLGMQNYDGIGSYLGGAGQSLFGNIFGH